MKRKYITQRDDYSCGPVAIYNALLALKEPPRSLRRVWVDCDPHPVYGTLYDVFDRTLRKHLPETTDCRYILQPDFSQVVKHIEQGGIAVVLEHWEKDNEEGEHYYTILEAQNDSFLVVNKVEGDKVNTLSRESLEKSLNKRQAESEESFYPAVWLLSQRN